jgi:hypothetical protein
MDWMRNSHHSFPGKMLSDLALIMAHGVVSVYDQLVLTNSPLGIRNCLGQFWDNHGQEVVLIGFLFRGEEHRGPGVLFQ